MKKIRVLELCAGYGSQCIALKNIGFDVYSEIAEIDKYASLAYNQINGNTKNYGDIYKIDDTKLPYFDMITYSTPCQDFSVAGLGKGGDKGSGTRSSLLWECERIIKAVKPKYLLMENVKNLLGKKHKHNFIKWIKCLDDMGYNNYWQVLNAKDYGVPQNRERVFVVSIRKDIKQEYIFPEKQKLKNKLKDLLENSVDSKYYLDEKTIDIFIKKDIDKTNFDVKDTLKIINNTKKGYEEASEYDSINLDQPNSKTRRGRVGRKISNTLLCSCNIAVVEPKILTYNIYQKVIVRKNNINTNKLIAFLREHKQKTGLTNYKISKELNLPLTKVEHWFRRDKSFAIPNADIWDKLKKILKIETSEFDKDITEFEEKISVFDKTNRCYSDEGISPTITTMSQNEKIITNYCIRKLTPRECWRLMGVKDREFNKLKGLSDNQLYKLAGNSIVVNVLEEIFNNLLTDKGKEAKGQLNLI